MTSTQRDDPELLAHYCANIRRQPGGPLALRELLQRQPSHEFEALAWQIAAVLDREEGRRARWRAAVLEASFRARGATEALRSEVEGIPLTALPRGSVARRLLAALRTRQDLDERGGPGSGSRRRRSQRTVPMALLVLTHPESGGEDQGAKAAERTRSSAEAGRVRPERIVVLPGVDPVAEWSLALAALAPSIQAVAVAPAGALLTPTHLRDGWRMLSRDPRTLAVTALSSFHSLDPGEIPLPAAEDSEGFIARRALLDDLGGPLALSDPAETARELIERIRYRHGAESVRRPAQIGLVRDADSVPGGARWVGERAVPLQENRAVLRAAIRSWHEAGCPDDRRPTSPAESSADLDVLYVSNLARSGARGGSQRSLLQAVLTALDAGRTVGLLHLQSPHSSGPGPGFLSPVFQELIDAGRVRRVILSDAVRVALVSVRYPLVLEFLPDAVSGIRARRVIIEANQGPAEADGSARRYRVSDCDRTAEALFGCAPVWYPMGALIRSQLAAERLPASRIGPEDVPGLIDGSVPPRMSPRPGVPVMGRYSRDHPMKWPATREALLTVYGDHRIRLRSMGGHTALEPLRPAEGWPPGWTLLDYDAESVAEFLESIDYFVYFHHPDYVEAFGRAVAEAMAAGVVVVLPEHFRPVFGEGAVYAAPEDVAAVVLALHTDSAAYAAQSARGVAYAEEHFGRHSYASLLARLLDEGSSPAPDRPVAGAS